MIPTRSTTITGVAAAAAADDADDAPGARPAVHRYAPGDRPLAGFTVEAFAGRGGFGEVYLATSDGGREVALKVLHPGAAPQDVELRGVRQVMNLKSPHLVTVFDVLFDEAGTPFVVMEFVRGPTLRELIRDAAATAAPGRPRALSPAKAAFFTREIARGLTHLHGQGVVHRDLKPANVFFENSVVKIGDYGLSKALGAAGAGATQTLTVGTVGYMAPEVGEGRYGVPVDVYALGCVLFEMLTGRVPFTGESPVEVLMKHLREAPPLDLLDEPFRRVVAKAMAKDPADRHATPAELVDDLLANAGVAEQVSSLNPEELSVAANRLQVRLSPERGAENPRTVDENGSKPRRSADSATPAGSSLPIDHVEPASWSPKPPLFPWILDSLSAEIDRAVAGPVDPAARAGQRDRPARRRAFAAGLALAVAITLGVVMALVDEFLLQTNQAWGSVICVFALGVGGPLAAVGQAVCRQQSLRRRSAVAVVGTVALVLVGTLLGSLLWRVFIALPFQAGIYRHGGTPIPSTLGRHFPEIGYVTLVVLLSCNWARPLHPLRGRQWSWSLPLLAGGTAAGATVLVWPNSTVLPMIFLAAAGTVLVAQTLSPLEPLPATFPPKPSTPLGPPKTPGAPPRPR